VGTGNGFFLPEMATSHPEWNWLGVEIRYKRVVLTARKIRAAGASNALVARYDAWYLDDLFGADDLLGLYLNFPDPWPRERQEKKRLLGPAFLEWAASALGPGGRLRVKTDSAAQVDRMVEAVQGLPFRVTERCADVDKEGSPWADDAVTNYQRKFTARGVAVHAIGFARA
jgi:tRNA (guanine-N7-)-methyltransferase